ncbi:MAG: hypothetical protein AAGD10_07495 [Myxococcota bacterium]
MAARLFQDRGFAEVVARPLLLLLCVACGSEAPPAETPGPQPVPVRIDPMLGGEAELRRLDGRLLGFDQGRPVWTTEVGLFRGDGSSETELEFVALDAGDLPPDRALAVVTSAEGAWLAADNGIYAVEGRFVLAVDALARPAWLTANLIGLDGLWWAEAERLVRWTAESSEELDLSSFGPATELSFSGSYGLVRIGARFFELAEGPEYTLLDVTPSAQGLGPSTGHDGSWWMVHEGGLLRRPAGSDEAWTPFLLAERRVQDVVSGADGALWIQTDRDLLRMDAPYEAAVIRSENAVEAMVHAPEGTVARLVDGSLQVWVDTTSELVGFEEDVLPWLTEQGCIACHSTSPGDYADYEVFSGLASEALSRVRSGDMPRCGAGLCPPEEQLTPEEYAVLEAWIAGGRPR